MIFVIASIRVKPGKQQAYLDIFKANVPTVRNEVGCLEYTPTIDFPSGLASQQRDEQVVTIIEKWDSLEALQTHLAAPHMVTYREQVKELVEGVTLKILQAA